MLFNYSNFYDFLNIQNYLKKDKKIIDIFELAFTFLIFKSLMV